MSSSFERRLSVELATPETVAPFGRLISAARMGDGRGTKYYGNAVELWSVDGFLTDADACLSVARVQPRECRVLWMERHFKHTQAFIPLNFEPFVVVMAPPNDKSSPEPDAVRALLFPSGCGLQLNVGTWHEFPFAQSAPVEIVVVLRNETNRNLEVIKDGEAVGGDLEKRNVERRLGVTYLF